LQDEILKSGASTIVLSSEYFSEALAIGLLRWICDRIDLDVSVIIYLRRQDRFLESGYNQAIKVGAETNKVVLGADYIESLDYAALLDRWGCEFGATALIVRTFEDAVAGPGILQDFARLVGADLDVSDATPDRNEALHPGLIEFRRVENVIGLTESPLTRLANPLLHKLDPRAGISLMTSENRRRFLDLYAKSNERVARRYLGRADGVLFAAPEQDSPEALVEPEASLSVLLSCGYNDLLEKAARAERQLKAVRAETEALRAELNALRSGLVPARSANTANDPPEMAVAQPPTPTTALRPSWIQRLMRRK
jgi:hypothetical protein